MKRAKTLRQASRTCSETATSYSAIFASSRASAEELQRILAAPIGYSSVSLATTPKTAKSSSDVQSGTTSCARSARRRHPTNRLISPRSIPPATSTTEWRARSLPRVVTRSYRMPNGEVERPRRSARRTTRAHTVFQRPRRPTTHASRPVPTIVRGRPHPAYCARAVSSAQTPPADSTELQL